MRRLILLAGRHAGKDRFFSAVAVWLAALCTDWRGHISAGEGAVVVRWKLLEGDGRCFLISAPYFFKLQCVRMPFGSCHVTKTQQRNRRDRHRYRYELIPRHWPGRPRVASRDCCPSCARKRAYQGLAGMARTYLVFGDIEGKLDVLHVECTRCQRRAATLSAS